MAEFVLKDYALTDLFRLKQYLKLPAEEDSQQDNIFIKWINSISREIMGLTKRNFELTTYTEEASPSNTRNLILNNRPITSITSIKVGDSDITDFKLTDESKLQGIVLRDYGWCYGYYIDVVYEAGYILPRETTKDTYTLPDELEEVVFNVISDLLAMEEKDGRVLSKITEGEVTYEFRKFVKGRLADYMTIINLNSDILV